MSTIDHVAVRASDLAASLELFANVFALLEFAGERTDGEGFFEWNDFSIAAADAKHPPTHTVHTGFALTSRSASVTTKRSGASTQPHSQLVGATTAPRANARSTTLATTAPTRSTLAGTTLKPFATTGNLTSTSTSI